MKAKIVPASSLLLALLLLQAVTVLPWHGDLVVWFEQALRPSKDLAVLLVLVLLGAAAGFRRTSAWLAGFVLWLLALLGPAMALHSLVFQRQFELADVLQFRGLIHLLLSRWPVVCQVLAMAGVVSIWPLLALAFLRIASLARSRNTRFASLGVPAAVALATWLGLPIAWQPSTAIGAVGMVHAAYDYWAHPERIDNEIRARIDAGFARMQAAPSELAGLRGVDVHVLVIESYGAIAWRDDRLRPHQETLWRELSQQLATRGMATACGRVHPAITGGGSWRAHQELFTAVSVPDQRTFERVLQGPARPLPSVFLAAGWHTVEAMPAMPRHWPEGDAFYGFAQSLVQADFPYGGHLFAFGHVPDQVVLHQLLERTVRPAERPLFTVFVSTSSHAPWKETPPFFADWVLDDAALTAPATTHALSWADVPAGERLFPAYRDSIEYALRSAVGYVCRLERPSLVLLLGDHQPPMHGQDASFEVPLHVLSNRPELLARWRELGFVDGDRPMAAATSMPLHDLAPTLLRLYQR
ncbi:MAG: hypothetical protein U1F60_15375 [Planctomycetota bacterium]